MTRDHLLVLFCMSKANVKGPSAHPASLASKKKFNSWKKKDDKMAVHTEVIAEQQQNVVGKLIRKVICHPHFTQRCCVHLQHVLV